MSRKHKKRPPRASVVPPRAKSQEVSAVPEWRPSNEIPIHYDEERVARLQPIELAIKNLRVPPSRDRKMGVIINALEVQIEDGGDSPEVNELLLGALRAGILHQVQESQARTALQTIDAFERAEASRWEQLKAGTPQTPTLPEEQELDALIRKGYEMMEARQSVAACDYWRLGRSSSASPGRRCALPKLSTLPIQTCTRRFSTGLPILI
jgi:hypothetical protein